MLGRSTAFANLVKEVGKWPVVSPRDADGNGEPVEKLNETPLAVLANAIRPFVLRRTKQQVLTELPEKMEQTLVCELEGEQKKLYRELKDFYRTSLGKRIESNGLEKSKIHVLEALLRLRQAACHPGLVHHNK
jgi:SNF2 family DNA or RNA helicase